MMTVMHFMCMAVFFLKVFLKMDISVILFIYVL